MAIPGLLGKLATACEELEATNARLVQENAKLRQSTSSLPSVSTCGCRPSPYSTQANESCKSSLHHLLDPKLDWQIQESTATGGTHQAAFYGSSPTSLGGLDDNVGMPMAPSKLGFIGHDDRVDLCIDCGSDSDEAETRSLSMEDSSNLTKHVQFKPPAWQPPKLLTSPWQQHIGLVGNGVAPSTSPTRSPRTISRLDADNVDDEYKSSPRQEMVDGQSFRSMAESDLDRGAASSRSSTLFAVFCHSEKTDEDNFLSKAWPLRYVHDRHHAAHAPENVWVFSPVGQTRVAWDALMLLMCVGQTWSTCFSLVFLCIDRDPAAMFVWEKIIAVVGAVDIVVNFMTSFFEDRVLVRRRKRIAMRYIRGWFIVDLLASFPFSLVYDPLKLAGLVRVLRAQRYLRYLRFLKLLRAARCVKSLAMASSGRTSSKKAKTQLRVLGGPLWIKVILLLALLAHVHGCLWATAQNWSPTEDLREAWSRYCTSFTWGFLGMMSGITYEEAENVRLLSLFMMLERSLLAFTFIYKIIMRALTRHDAVEELEKLQDEIITYLHDRHVGHDAQLEVVCHLEETVKANKLRSRYPTLMKQDFPDDLKGRICTLLWSENLQSLDLIYHLASWRPEFLQDLAILVEEEVFAHDTVIYKQGASATGAYYIIEGLVGLVKGRAEMLFSESMWVGEKSLVNASLKRSSTCRTHRVCTVMYVPASGFRELLDNTGLRRRFEELCSDEVCRGLCGRCGSLGDHFSFNCPFDMLEPRGFIGGRSKQRHSNRNNGSVPAAQKNLKRRSSITDGADDQCKSPTQQAGSLLEFLRQNKLEFIAEGLMKMGIFSLTALKDIDVTQLKAELEGEGHDLGPEGWDTLGSALAPDVIEAFQTRISCLIMGDDHLLQDEHLVFLSHAKAEAGIECELIRVELNQLIQDQQDRTGKKFQNPVFLDTEDLQNLQELQQHVRNSHNIALILTRSVLTRPWCLVEIATAVEAGIRVLPVELNKKGMEFEYPDEVFYSELRTGRLLGEAGMSILQECNLELESVERSIREVFKQISLPYTPARAANIRKAELEALLRSCRVSRGRRERVVVPQPPELAMPADFVWQLS